MGYPSFLAKKLLFAAVTVLIIMTLNFAIFRLMPGDPVAMLADQIRLRPEQVARLYELFNLDKPMWEQYVSYMIQTLQGFLGYSYYTQRPVTQDIMERLPNTLLLVGVSTIISIVIGMVVGIVAAAKRGSAVDIGAISFGFLGNSVPTFWLGILLLLVFGVNLQWFPLRGTTSVPSPTEPIALVLDILWHMALPTLVLVIIQFGGFALVMRAAMMDVLTEDYITLARAKGIDERNVLYKHALRNAMLPMVTVIALAFGFTLSGALLTETVFSWYGLGRYIWEAIVRQDFPALQGIFFIISVMVVAANLLADIIYGFLDPRVKHE
ncbi:TPA: ABC transporter permease [Candidatus Bathyarchaeota archaeon]|nr:ABC transporter permease [Candidatus Bathyarchaeota archaeon]